MINFSNIASDIITWASIGLLGVLVSSVWRLVKIIGRIEIFMKTHEERLTEIEDRAEVHDDMFSDISGQSVNSSRIVKGIDQKPKFVFIRKTREQ